MRSREESFMPGSHRGARRGLERLVRMALLSALAVAALLVFTGAAERDDVLRRLLRGKRHRYGQGHR